MRVQRVVMPGSELGSWTLLGEDHVPVEPVERFLGYLASVERSPNTIKAYAHDLKDWFSFLALRGLDWRRYRHWPFRCCSSPAFLGARWSGGPTLSGL